MSELQKTNFSRSIIFKVIVVLIVSMTLVVTCSTYLYNKKQTQLMLEWNFNNNDARVKQIASVVNSEMTQFGNKLSLLAKTSEIQSMDPTIAASYLKSYNVSSLFISGETVSIYDRENNFICNNSMVGLPTASPYPVEFSKITPHHPYITPWLKEKDAIPQRIFGINITNRVTGDGSLVASFSLRRLWNSFSDFKIGKGGFLIVTNSQGEILYHPNRDKWLNDTHKIAELGLADIDPRSFDVKEVQFRTLSDSNSYLINFHYDYIYDFAVFSFQPKSEIDEIVASTTMANIFILAGAILVILVIAGWMFYILGIPLRKLISHINQITNGNLDIDEIHVGKRKDEIGKLSRAFNQMHSTIKRQIGELNAHRDMLEQEVRERTIELERANQKLDQISKTDELTGLPNRREMNETIANEIGRAQRSRKPFCFIFIDIDHFKMINDTYGHACGDIILKSVAQTIRNLLRKYDVFARYGGEEFLTLLPETDLEGAQIVAERFRQQIENMTVQYADYTIKITITLGVARFDNRLGADRSIQLADKALYQGKENGRNRVVVWQPEWTTESDYEAAAIELAETQKTAEDQNIKVIVPQVSEEDLRS